MKDTRNIYCSVTVAKISVVSLESYSPTYNFISMANRYEPLRWKNMESVTHLEKQKEKFVNVVFF